MKHVDIYTDGACKGNPGPGGWAAILVFGSIEKEICGGELETTNNRMELLAVVKALSALKEPCNVNIFSDSKYFVDSLKLGRVYQWRSKGWKTANGKASNVDLWERILSLIKQHKVTPIWVKGHDGNSYNERCDKLASGKAKEFSMSPF